MVVVTAFDLTDMIVIGEEQSYQQVG